MSYSHRLMIPSPLGDILVQGTQTHIQYLKFNTVDQQPLETQLESANVTPDWSKECCLQLKRYFLSQQFEFDLPIDPHGTEFQQKVWQALLGVQYGSVASYQQLAADIGNKNAVRAVASANARNPIWLIIPCHRIIGSDNALRGYAGGIARKAKLLQIEHHTLDLNPEQLVLEKLELERPQVINAKTKILR